MIMGCDPLFVSGPPPTTIQCDKSGIPEEQKDSLSKYRDIASIRNIKTARRQLPRPLLQRGGQGSELGTSPSCSRFLQLAYGECAINPYEAVGSNAAWVRPRICRWRVARIAILCRCNIYRTE